MSSFARYSDAVADGDPSMTYRFMRDLDQRLDQIDTAVGGIKKTFVDSPTDANTPVPPPSPAAFEVLGIDGKYKVAILNPQDINPSSPLEAQFQFNNTGSNSSGTPILHNLQSATTTAFDNASSVTDYGVSSQLSYEFQDPNQTKFFRLRSSYDGQNWNAWQLYSSALTCGPVGVQSGVARSIAIVPNAALNNSNNATVDSIDAGASATIRAYGTGGVGSSWTHFDGQGGQTPVNAGTVLGASYTTMYTVMFDPPYLPPNQPGTGTGYHAYPTLTQYASAIMDNLWATGKLTTVAGGGGGGSTGGGGGSDGGGGGGRGII